MELKDLTIADGRIEAIRSSVNDCVVTFRDWQEERWDILFVNVIGVENFNIEGEELDSIIEEEDSSFIARSRKMAKEPNEPMMCYSFRSPWNDESLLRIVANRCEVTKLGSAVGPVLPDATRGILEG